MTDSSLSASNADNAASNCTGFLDLSAEIRNSIYELAFVKPGPILVKTRHSQGNWHNGVWQGSLTYDKRVALYAQSTKRTDEGIFTCNETTFGAGILATCHQIHDEATPILYGANIFLISLRWRCEDLPVPLHDNNLQHIHHLIFGPWGRNTGGIRDAMAMLERNCKSFKQLRKIGIASAGEIETIKSYAEGLAGSLAPSLKAIGRLQGMRPEEVAEMVEYHPEDYNWSYFCQTFRWQDVDRVLNKASAAKSERLLKEALKALLEPEKDVEKSESN